MKAEIILKVDSLYKVINDPINLKAQQFINNAPNKIEDKLSYDITEHTIKLANDVVKTIEITRKAITSPLDAYKKQIMEIEKDAVEPIKKYIESSKTKMLAYNEELERIQREANEKLRIESEKALEDAPFDVFNTLAGYFVDQAVSINTEQPKNIRVTKKARINGEVNWSMVLNVLFAAEVLDYQELLTPLAKAMEKCGVVKIDGIEIYDHKTQVIR
jgi:prolyl oligopeptidase PreP (S9A serine peptidase family)